MKRTDYKVLVLNKDWQPLSRVPLSTISWQEAFRLCYQGKARPLNFYDDIVHTSTEEFPVPSVIVLEDYKKLTHIARLSKFNVKLRDNFHCQYCHKRFSARSLTVDHVRAKSKGGRLTWTNSATACKPCNNRKKNHHEMKPSRTPYQPNYFELAQKMVDYNSITNENWAQYTSFLTKRK